MSILLHVGACKCGSSAIQTALSAKPTFRRRDGSEVNYVAIDAARPGLVDKQRLATDLGVQNYRVSATARKMLATDFQSIASQLKAYPTDIVLSREAWLFESAAWGELLHATGLEVDVIVYVRPQVPVLNSAWWQWGAWGTKPFDDWMAQHLNRFLWGERVKQWSSLPGVRSVTVRPVPDDVLLDIYDSVFDAAVPDEARGRSNTSLPGSVLRLMQRNRILREGPHASRMDFVLSRNLTMREPPTWVVNKEWMRRILDGTREDNRLLMSFMDESSAEKVRQDDRWWSAAAYASKQAEDPNPQPIPAEKLEELCVSLALGMAEMARKRSS